jgi:uncharacterized protein (DUF2237 family)
MYLMGRARNVLGGELKPCSLDPLTGFHRDGCCQTGPGDVGLHLLCAQVTAEFLEYSRSRGNDLITPVPELEFPGLKPGDRWCLCIDRLIARVHQRRLALTREPSLKAPRAPMSDGRG